VESGARIVLVFVAASSIGACGSRDDSQHEVQSSMLGEDVVARIGSREIGRDEVLATAQRLGRSPRDTLDAIVALELLAREADARGFGERNESRSAVDRRLVQALLERTVEAGVDAPVDEAAVAEQIERLRPRSAEALFDENAARGEAARRLRIERERADLAELVGSLEPGVERPVSDDEVDALLARIVPAGTSP
jgi:hypothetical protein